MNPLSDIELFRGLNKTALVKVQNLARTVRKPRGAHFFRQGQEADSFYVLLSGRLRAVQTAPDGRDVVIRYVHPHDLFGCVTAFGEERYPGTSEVIEDAIALCWDRKATEAMMRDFPPIALNAMRSIGRRLRVLQDRNRELSTEQVEQRIARALSRIVRQAGLRVEDGVLIDFPIRQQDLAEMTGTTLYTVSRIFREWAKKGIIRTARRKIIVAKPHQLVSIAEDLRSN
jgi:CRP-like cAMP-binding protein